MSTKTNPLNQFIADMKKKADDLVPLKARIVEINDQIKTIENEPMGIDDFCLYLRRWVEAKGRKFAESLRVEAIFQERAIDRDHPPIAKCGFGPLETYIEHDFMRVFGEFSSLHNQNAGDRFGMLCFFMPDVICEKLTQEIKTRYADKWPGGIDTTVAQRKATIANLVSERETTQAQADAIQAEIEEAETALQSIKG